MTVDHLTDFRAVTPSKVRVGDLVFLPPGVPPEPGQDAFQVVYVESTFHPVTFHRVWRIWYITGRDEHGGAQTDSRYFTRQQRAWVKLRPHA